MELFRKRFFGNNHNALIRLAVLKSQPEYIQISHENV